MVKRPTKHMRRRSIELRAHLTLSERRIWGWLRNRTRGFKFRRQVAIDHFVVDFFCPELKLAIEIDGRQHEDPRVAERDELRRSRLATLGIEIVRVTNHLVATDPQSASAIIQWAIDSRAHR